jgi:DNA-binding CsgD family transcriptional regulator
LRLLKVFNLKPIQMTTFFKRQNICFKWPKSLNLTLALLALFCTYWGSAQQLTKAQAKAIYQTQVTIHKSFYNDSKAAKKQLDSLVDDSSPSWPDSLIVGNYKLKGIYYQRIFELDSSEFYLRKVIALEKKNLKTNPFNLFNLGVTLKKKQDYKEALEVLTNAHIIAENNKNHYALSLVKEEISSIYSRLQNFQLALDYRLEAIALIKNRTPLDSLGLAYSEHNLADLYFKLKNYKDAEALFKKVSAKFKQYDNLTTYYLANTNLANTYIETGALKKADSLINLALEGFATANNTNYMSYAQETKAKILVAQNKLAEAQTLYSSLVEEAYNSYNERLYNLLIHYFDVLDRLNKKDTLNAAMLRFVAFEQNNTALQFGVYDKTEVYKFLLDHLSQAQNTKAFNYAKDQLYLVQDALVNAAEYNIKKQLESEFQKQSIEKDKLLLDQKNKILNQAISKKNQWLIFISLILAILIIAAFVFVKDFNRIKALKERENALLLAKEESLLSELNAKKELNDFKNKEIKEYKNKLLTLAIEAQDFKDKLKLYTAKKMPNDQNLKALTQEGFNFKYWDLLIDKYKRYNPNFTAYLEALNPDTTARQIDFCILVKLGINNRVIASALNISYETVISTKSRLKKHFNIDKDTSFDAFIEAIAS